MEALVRLNNQTSGRDKLARVIQYASKFLWSELQNMKVDVRVIEKLQILESTCSSFRKLLRFGRFSDSLYSALSTLNHPDTVLRLTITLGKIANSLFLFADHIIWLSRTGLLRNVDSNRWITISNKYWLLNIIFNIIRDLYEIKNILCNQNIFAQFKNKLISEPFNFNVYLHLVRKSFLAVSSRQDVTVDTIKNVCDLWIPSAGLGIVNIKPTTIGFLGTISSLAAVYAILRPNAKLIPS